MNSDQPTEHALSAPELQLLTEYNQLITTTQMRMEGLLMLVLRQNGLVGNWNLEPSRPGMLVRTDAVKEIT